MAHFNIDERRAYVSELLNNNKNKGAILHYTTTLFGCALGAVYADIKYLQGIEPEKRITKTYRIKNQVLDRDNHSCQYCSKKKEKLILEHIIPVKLGGETVYENLVAACASCNSKKMQNIWVPINFDFISAYNKTHYSYVVNNAAKDCRRFLI